MCGLLTKLLLGAAVATAIANGSRAVYAEEDGRNPLLRENAEQRASALAEGRIIYLRSCRPCHGMLGLGDGPHAGSFGTRASTLVTMPAAQSDGERFRRIADGSVVPRSEKGGPAGGGIPAFRDALSDRQIWSVLLALDELRAVARAQPGRPAATSHAARGAPRARQPAKASYAARCAPCHGTDGKGDGPLAPELYPRPRDFTRASYRVRSTASGTRPDQADLRRTLERGLGDTAMGGFGALGDDALADLVRQLARFAPERFEEPVKVLTPSRRAPPPATRALVARGRELYDEARCWQCHGRAGRGDGPSARELLDDTGDASLPANLTKSWQFKGGPTVADLFRTVTTGMNGTPMPSYAEAIDEPDRWALARYVESLGRVRAAPPAGLHPAVVESPLPDDPADPLWNRLSARALPLGPQMLAEPRWARPSVDVMHVAVAVNEREIGFLLRWDDRFEDRGIEDMTEPRAQTIDARRVGRWRLPDAVALELALIRPSAPKRPPRTPGSTTEPGVRWMWAADRGAEGVRVERMAGPLEPAPAAKEPELADEPPAPGQGTPERPAPQASAPPQIRARALFADGEWRVAIVGSRETGLLSPEVALSVAIQVWDGGYGETGLRHARSESVRLELPRAVRSAEPSAGGR